jgi:hypothetical protein
MLKQLNVKPLHQGVLLKQSDWMRVWRPRFFAIYGSRLFICSDANPSDNDEPKVEIDFSRPSPHLTMKIITTPDRRTGILLLLVVVFNYIYIYCVYIIYIYRYIVIASGGVQLHI